MTSTLAVRVFVSVQALIEARQTPRVPIDTRAFRSWQGHGDDGHRLDNPEARQTDPGGRLDAL